MNDMEKFQDNYMREDMAPGEDQELKNEMKEMNRLFEDQRLTKDAFYKKRSKRQET
jgi:hypothetical protein